jgi:SAM-dependent methyltransferase
MKLSELVTLNNQLKSLTVTDIHQDTNCRIEKILYEIQKLPEPIDNFLEKINANNHILQQSFVQFENELSQLKLAIKDQIHKQEPAWLQKSYEFYEKTLANRDSQRPEAVTYNRNRRVIITLETESLLRTRVARYSDWRYPAVIIHPMHEPFMEDLVGSDPLYIVDESHYLLEPVLSRYNAIYQNRLRPYVIEESFDYPILDKLPNKQFNLCFVYNYLNFRPFEIIKKYLAEIYQKLRPGGMLIITFNDCERASAIANVEQNYGAYTTGYLVEQLAINLGYNIHFKWNDNGPSTWLELQRPGELTTIKGGQSLAKILPNPVAKSK